MIYEVQYFLGRPKALTSHSAEVEAENAFYALQSFRAENPGARVSACIEKLSKQPTNK